MSESMKTEITVRLGTLVKIAAVVALAALVFYLRDIAALLVVAIVLAILISPVADFCERHRLPRALGIAAVYIFVLGLFGVIFTLVAQPIIAEVKGLAGSLPTMWERIAPTAESLRSFSVEHGLVEQLKKFASGIEGKLAAGAFGVLTGAFGGIFSFVLVLVLSFYLANSANVVRRALISLAPAHLQPFFIGVVPRIERKMGCWLRGIVTLALIMGVVVFIGLSILRVEYAILIALLTAVVEIIPMVGAPIAATVGVILTLFQSPIKALFVLIFFIVVQQLENHILVPKIMQRAVGINPVVSLLALLIGAKIGGIPGALLAIPIATGLIVFGDEYIKDKRNRSTVPR